MQESISEYSDKIECLLRNQELSGSSNVTKESISSSEQLERIQSDESKLTHMIEISVGNGEQIRSLMVH